MTPKDRYVLVNRILSLAQTPKASAAAFERLGKPVTASYSSCDACCNCFTAVKPGSSGNNRGISRSRIDVVRDERQAAVDGVGERVDALGRIDMAEQVEVVLRQAAMAYLLLGADA